MLNLGSSLIRPIPLKPGTYPLNASSIYSIILSNLFYYMAVKYGEWGITTLLKEFAKFYYM